MKYAEFHTFCAENGFGAKYIAMRDAVHKVIESPRGAVNAYFMAMYLVFYAAIEGNRERMINEVDRLFKFWNQDGIKGTKNDPIHQFNLLIQTAYNNIAYVAIDPALPFFTVVFKDAKADGKTVKAKTIAERWAKAMGMNYSGGDSIAFPEIVPNEPKRTKVSPIQMIQYSGDLFGFLGRTCVLNEMAKEISKSVVEAQTVTDEV